MTARLRSSSSEGPPSPSMGILTKSIGLVIVEDGLFIAQWTKSLLANLNPVFLWQILNARSTLNAALSGILIIPNTYAPTLQTPWDSALTSKSDIWTVVTQPANAIPMTYTTDYLRAATASLSTANSTVTPKAVTPLVDPTALDRPPNGRSMF